MANTLGVYNPTFYAQEALIQLEANMGLANRVYRRFEDERNAFQRGETTQIRRPSTFTAANAPSSAQDLNTQAVTVTLDQWKEVKFSLTDKELSFTQERIIEDHIRPAAVALADNIDTALASLWYQTPWKHAVASSTDIAASDFPQVRKLLFDNKAPVNDIDNMHLMLDGAMEAEALGLSAFSQQQGAGDAGVQTQMRGALGTKYGFNVFANQNTQASTAGSLSTSGTVAVDGAITAGDTSITVDASTSMTGTLKAGDTLSFAGIDQHYTVLADATAAANEITFTIGVPGRGTSGTGALTAIADGTVVTFYQQSAIGEGLAFHRNAIGLVVAPLSELGDGKGAEISTIKDPITQLSLRARMYYDGDNSKLNVALDVLYGYTVLDANLMARLQNVD